MTSESSKIRIGSILAFCNLQRNLKRRSYKIILNVRKNWPKSSREMPVMDCPFHKIRCGGSSSVSLPNPHSILGEQKCTVGEVLCSRRALHILNYSPVSLDTNWVWGSSIWNSWKGILLHEVRHLPSLVSTAVALTISLKVHIKQKVNQKS